MSVLNPLFGMCVADVNMSDIVIPNVKKKIGLNIKSFVLYLLFFNQLFKTVVPKIDIS